MPDALIAIILGIVEGVTEFLPISSTAHLVLCERLLDIDLDQPFWKMFTVFIQIGAIAAVVVYFRRRITDLVTGGSRARRTAKLTRLEIMSGKLAGPGMASSHEAPPAADRTSTAQKGHVLLMIGIGSLPLVLAYIAHKWAEQNIQSPRVIAAALGIGGLIMIAIDLFRPTANTHQLEAMTWKQALGIGLAQIVAAIFPGTSRSAATIVGGEIAGLSRPAAAEFSFFLAIPAMTAACGFSLLKHRASLDLPHALLLAVGTIVSFVVAWAVIAAFMSYIRRHSFVPFAIYRILLSIIVFLIVARA